MINLPDSDPSTSPGCYRDGRERAGPSASSSPATQVNWLGVRCGNNQSPKPETDGQQPRTPKKLSSLRHRRASSSVNWVGPTPSPEFHFPEGCFHRPFTTIKARPHHSQAAQKVLDRSKIGQSSGSGRTGLQGVGAEPASGQKWRGPSSLFLGAAPAPPTETPPSSSCRPEPHRQKQRARLNSEHSRGARQPALSSA